MLNLYQALRVTSHSRIALVGSGGKTTALFQLARQVNGPVVVTASTHLGTWQASFADRHIVIERPEDVERFAGQIEGVTLLSGPAGNDYRLGGLDADILDAVYNLSDRLGFPLLIEADGSRQHPLKAPASHEPVIPKWVDMVVVVAGLSGLGKTLDDQNVFRPGQFALISGLSPGEIITEEGLKQALAHPNGGLKGIPAGTRKAVLLNQADEAAMKEGGLRVANHLMGVFDAGLVASLKDQIVWKVIEPVAGILLAGGESSRFGQPKMLLPWHGKPIVRHVAEAALAGGLNPLVVVLGAVDDPIREALAGLPVNFVVNPAWQEGQSTSLQQGLRQLGNQAAAAVFLLADQPVVPPQLIHEIIQRHEETLAPVIAPRVTGRRANPVLFDRVTFPALLSLTGDTGGRAIFNRFSPEYVDWPDVNLLLDIDTPEDYIRLKEME